MQLRRLRLRNIRSYESADLEFGPGTTLVAGDVGAGKTSLLYAIEMALFGFAEVDASHLIRHGAVHAEVAVTLEHDGHRYEISRQFRRLNRRGRDTFDVERLSFAKDGAKTIYSTTELRQQVIDLFGFPDNPNPRTPSDLWRWAVYVPQERMREVLGQRPEDRLETVRKALGVERYRVAAENAQDVAAEIRQTARVRRDEADRLAHYETELADASRELEAVELRLVALAQALAEGRSRLEEATGGRSRAEASRDSAQGDVRELEGIERESVRDRNDLAAGERRQIEIEREIALPGPAPGASEAVAAKLLQLETERSALETERDRLDQGRTAIEGRLRERAQALTERDAALRRRTAVDSERRNAEGELTTSRDALERTRSEGPTKEPPEPTRRTVSEIDALLLPARRHASRTDTERAAASSESEEWTKLIEGGVCPRCHQEVRAVDFESHRTEATARLTSAEGAAVAARGEVERLEEERRARERFERARDRWLDAEKIRHLAGESVVRAEARLGAVRAEETSATESQDRAEERAAALEAVVAEERDWNARAESLTARRKAVDAGVDATRRESEALRATADLRRELAREREQVLRQMESLRTRLADRAAASARLQESRGHLPELERIWEEAREAETNLRTSVEERQLDEVRAERDADAWRRRRADAERGVADRVRLLAEEQSLERKAEWLGHDFREALLVMEARILASAQASFQRDFARFFRALLDDPTLEARVGESFTPSVLIKGAWTPAEALSGGERTSLALAFRLALGRVVRSMGELHLDTLILDEPTDGFSPEQVVRMGDLLESLGLPQVILVSHEFELSSVADRVIEARKVDGVSVLSSGTAGAVATPPAEDEAVEPRRRRSRRARVGTLPDP